MGRERKKRGVVSISPYIAGELFTPLRIDMHFFGLDKKRGMELPPLD
jgi:hypothetical protein